MANTTRGPDQAGFTANRLPFTQAEDWVIHHPLMTGPAMLLYMRLRSTTYEKTMQKKSKVFTVEQMRTMVPGEKGKNTSASNIRKHLKLLQTIGAISRVNANRMNETPIYEFPAEPPAGYDGWLSGYDWGNAITEGAAGAAPDDEGSLCTEGGAAGAEGGAVRAAPKGPLTCRNGSSKKSFKKSSKNPPQEGGLKADSAPAGREEESASASKTSSGSAPSPSAPDPSPESVRLVEREMSLLDRERREIAVLVDGAVALGHAAVEVVKAFKRKVGPKAHSPVAICRGVARENFSERPSSARPKRFVQPRNRWDCPDCHGDLFVEDERGDLTVKCFHVNLVPVYD
ncbi:hypothetical protein ABT282_07800 [Streptomyces sp. NPDC000927]|uniref:hypothetical protein n=1 Tax=Streptomyces sp. NPDC000927 TaxID=3154371 RepID=UPI0033269B0D